MSRILDGGLVVALAVGAFASASQAFDELVPGKLLVAKPDGKLVEFVATHRRPARSFNCPRAIPPR